MNFKYDDEKYQEYEGKEIFVQNFTNYLFQEKRKKFLEIT